LEERFAPSAARSLASSPRRCWPPTASNGRRPTPPWRSGPPTASRSPKPPGTTI